MLLQEWSDLCLHCLHRPISLKYIEYILLGQNFFYKLIYGSFYRFRGGGGGAKKSSENDQTTGYFQSFLLFISLRKKQ